MRRPARALVWNVILVVLVLGVLFGVFPALLAFAAGLESSTGLRFWLQTLAGNWPGTNDAQADSFLFGVSAVLAVVLNNGLIWVIVLFVWAWGKRWRLAR